LDPKNLSAEELNKFQQSQGQLSQALGRLMVVAEQYPQLRATEAFRDLTVQLEGTENRITVERQKFNEVVQTYNSTIKVFPRNLLAGMYGFKEKPFFAADKGANKAPEVKF
jgi:LemA protein